MTADAVRLPGLEDVPYSGVMGVQTPTRRSIELRALIDRHREELLAVLARHGATNPRVFGSVARGDADSQSDLDILIEAPKGMGLFGLSRLQLELADILGTKVDVVPDKALLNAVRPSALADAVPL
ncbi:nucleotidyltransferase family protein [Microbacterium sp.]|uniref:nucleotidyltransferase family protein n=1 Tax=Microbacterium sp. TaxID=51671 RepID=UPI003C782EC4